jgi:branched-subunit amino acid transport protein AzlD
MSIVTMALTVVLTVIAFMEDNPGAMVAVYAAVFAGGVFSVLFTYFLVHRLQDGFGMKLLVAGVIVGITSYAVLVATMGAMGWEEDQADDTEERQDIREYYGQFAYVYLGLSAVSSVLFIMAIANAYMRIYKGKLVPIPPAPAYYYYAYLCPKCGRPLELLHEHWKWWCEDCGRSF